MKKITLPKAQEGKEITLLRLPESTVTVSLPKLKEYETIRVFCNPYKELEIQRENLNWFQKILLNLFF